MLRRDFGLILVIIAVLWLHSGGIMFWMVGSLADIGEHVKDGVNFGHSSVVI